MNKELRRVKLEELIPYENNPRNNDNAVEPTAESIAQVGYITPIIVDEDMTILAGHTRVRSLESLGESEADVLVVEGMTEEQKRKYRILDNKTGEFAGWDWVKLQEELDDLDFGDYDFGFPSADDIDIDSLWVDSEEEPKEEEPKTIQCPHCGQWFEI